MSYIYIVYIADLIRGYSREPGAGQSQGTGPEQWPGSSGSQGSGSGAGELAREGAKGIAQLIEWEDILFNLLFFGGLLVIFVIGLLVAPVIILLFFKLLFFIGEWLYIGIKAYSEWLGGFL